MKNTTFFRTLIIGAGMATSMVMSPATFAGGNNCSEYRLSAYGGNAGFRVMSGSRDFRQANNGSVVGNICQTGNVQIELSKQHPGTRVSLALNGREYVFGEGDRGDRHVNNWFRRYVNVDLGHYAKPQRKPQKWKHKDHADSGYRQSNDSYRNNRGYSDEDYVDNQPRRRDHNGYDGQDDNRRVQYNQGSHSSNDYYDRGYDNNNGNKAHRHHKLPRFAVHSKRHRKAHRRDIPHRHKKQQGHRYVTYH